jgi:PAS domain S-box-containing protein
LAWETTPGAAEVVRDLEAVDWGGTALGDPSGWPDSLKTMVRVLLSSRFSMWMAWGPELTFFCNDAYRRDTLGKKYPWALGRPAREVWAEIWPDIQPRIETVMESGEATWDEELQLFLERSGYTEETYHTFSYSPLPGDDGRISGMLCVVSEVTDRVIADQRMGTLRDLGSVPADVRDEQEFIRAAMRHLGANLCLLPFTLVYLLEGERAKLAGAAGLNGSRHVAAPALELNGPDSIWPLRELLQGRSVVVESIDERFEELPTGGWEEPPNTALLVPLSAPGDERPYGFLVFGVNRYRPLDEGYRTFTELIAQRIAAGIGTARSYAAERARAEQLAELDRAKTVFFSNVSHELRTPLTLMLGPLQDALLEPNELEPDQLEMVHRNGLRLLKLVNALLDFARLEAGRLRAEFHPVDLASLTSELAGTFNEAATRAGLSLRISCPPVPGQAYVDPDLWERIVLNLLSNAFKVTMDGEIAVELCLANDQVELWVTDTGPGIPPEDQQQLFQRFHRVSSLQARTHEGTGIGLALVKELVELHGGEVAVQSVVGHGSRFIVRLPLGSDHLPADQVHEEPRGPGSDVASLFVVEALSWISSDEAAELPSGNLDAESDDGRSSRGPIDISCSRVLVADDNPDLRNYLTRLLRPHMQVTAVGDGATALTLAQEHPPDLLITDVMMPGLDGYELLAALRSAPETRELPVIMLSARAGEEASIEGLRAGADDYLPKPFSARELLARVRAHLELSLVRREAAFEVSTERQRLEQTLQQLPAGVILSEASSGRVILANSQVSEILGHELEAGENFAERAEFPAFDLDGAPLSASRRPLMRAIRDGEEIHEEDILYQTGHGTRITMRVSAAPIRDEDGEIMAGVLVFQDVTDRVHNEQLLASQRDILAMVATGRPLSGILEEIARAADRLSVEGGHSAIMLRSEDGRRLHGATAPNLPPGLMAALDGMHIGPAAGSCGTAAHRGEPVLVADITTDPLWSDFRDACDGTGLRSCWSTPLHATNGELIGTFAVYYGDSHLPSQQERETVSLLSQTAAVAIERARDAQSRTRQLVELQSSLLPRRLPDVPGLRSAVRFFPGDRMLDVGGDFYDLFPMGENEWGFVIGDVRGHGAGAAAVTALTRHTTRAVARLQLSPGQVLGFVSDALKDSGYDRFCTAIYGSIETGAGATRVRLASGGHPPALLARAGGRIETLRAHGPLLGVFDAPLFPEIAVELGPDDALLLYTDGLIERNPRVEDDNGLERLLETIPPDTAGAMLERLVLTVLGEPPLNPADDVAILLLQATGPAEEESSPGAASAVGAV